MLTIFRGRKYCINFPENEITDINNKYIDKYEIIFISDI